MDTAIVVVSLILAAAFAASGIPKVLALPFARKQAEHTGMSVNAYRIIGLLELAGALGLLIGLWWTPLAVAAAVGLVLLMVGAVVAHVRLKDPVGTLLPGLGLGLLAAVVVVLSLSA